MTSLESQEFIPTPLVRVTYPDGINLHTVLNNAKKPYARYADTELLDIILGNRRARKKKPVEIPPSSGILNRFKSDNDPLISGQIATVHLIPPKPLNNFFNFNLVSTLLLRKDQPPPAHSEEQIQSLLAHLKRYGLDTEVLEWDLPPGMKPAQRVIRIGTHRLELPIPVDPSLPPNMGRRSLNFYMKKGSEEDGVPTVYKPETCAGIATSYADTYGKVVSSWYEALRKQPSFQEIIFKTPATLTMDDQ